MPPENEEYCCTTTGEVIPSILGNESVSDSVILKPNTELPKPVPYCSIFELINRSATEPPVHMIWSGIKKGSFGYVYGPAKSGKTILCENLGMSIAAGKNTFLGMALNCTGINNVLFISMEENWKNRTERNLKQINALEGFNRDNFNYYVVNEAFPYSLTDKSSWDTFTDTISSTSANLVIVDSLTRVTRSEIEKSTVGSEVSAKLRDITRNLDITMVVIHHSSKISNSAIDISNMAGSRVIGQEADFILGVNKLANNTRYFKEVANRYKQESEHVTVFQIDNNLWVKKIRTATEERLLQPVDHRGNEGSIEMVLDAIQELEAKDNLIKRKDVVNLLNGQLGQSRIYEIFKELEINGLIEIKPQGFIGLSREQEE